VILARAVARSRPSDDPDLATGVTPLGGRPSNGRTRASPPGFSSPSRVAPVTGTRPPVSLGGPRRVSAGPSGASCLSPPRAAAGPRAGCPPGAGSPPRSARRGGRWRGRSARRRRRTGRPPSRPGAVRAPPGR